VCLRAVSNPEKKPRDGVFGLTRYIKQNDTITLLQLTDLLKSVKGSTEKEKKKKNGDGGMRVVALEKGITGYR
jgi:hypothetical protein